MNGVKFIGIRCKGILAYIQGPRLSVTLRQQSVRYLATGDWVSVNLGIHTFIRFTSRVCLGTRGRGHSEMTPNFNVGAWLCAEQCTGPNSTG